jgi:hypothetical protein
MITLIVLLSITILLGLKLYSLLLDMGIHIELLDDRYRDLMSLFISLGVTILGFFLVVLIYLLTTIRPNVFNSDSNKKPNNRFYVSHKTAGFVYPFGFISFMICAYPLSVLAIISIFNGVTTTSLFIILLSIVLYILFIKIFQKVTSPLVPFWKMHKQSTHKILVYYVINIINIIMASVSILFIKPIYGIVAPLGFTSNIYYKTILVMSLFSLWGFIYFVIQNASFVYVLGTDYIIYEPEISALNSNIENIKEIDTKVYNEMKKKWKYLLPDKNINANIDIEEINKDTKILDIIYKNPTC